VSSQQSPKISFVVSLNEAAMVALSWLSKAQARLELSNSLLMPFSANKSKRGADPSQRVCQQNHLKRDNTHDLYTERSKQDKESENSYAEHRA
jgi:hypothetical protein